MTFLYMLAVRELYGLWGVLMRGDKKNGLYIEEQITEEKGNA